jgi:hypothetical protein
MWLLCLLKHGCIWSATELRCKCKCIYFTLLLMFMIKYAYSSFTSRYFSFYRGKTTKTLWLTQQVLASSTLERGYRHSSYRKSLVQKGEFHFTPHALCYMTAILCVIVNWYIGFVVETMNTLCNIWLVNIIECVISLWLYVSVCVCCLCRYNAAAKSWLPPGCSQQPGCPLGGGGGGHQIGDARLIGCVSY